MSCARAGVPDNNAIAAVQRINRLILDIALNILIKALLKMTKDASGGLV
jgi:hypothetical protein